jgi:hypothetical protein
MGLSCIAPSLALTKKPPDGGHPSGGKLGEESGKVDEPDELVSTGAGWMHNEGIKLS